MTKPMNKHTHSTPKYRYAQAIRTLFASCPQVTHHVTFTPRDQAWLRAWHTLGRRHRKERPGAPTKHHHHPTLSDFGHLTILAYQVGAAGAAWTAASAAIVRKNRQPRTRPGEKE